MKNPLLHPSSYPHSAIAFHELKPKNFPEALEQAIAHGQEILKRVRELPANFENTIRGIEHATEESEFVFTLFNNLLIANTNTEMQALANALGPKVADFTNDILLDGRLFKKVSEVYDTRHQQALNPEQIHLVEKLHRDFSRNGGQLEESQKARLRAIDERLSQLQPKFRENVLKATNSFSLWLEKEEQTEGLPPTLKASAKEAAREQGRPQDWLITLDAPSVWPFLKHSVHRDLREQVMRAFQSRAFGGKFDNQANVIEIANLMTEKAKLLGAESYAHHVLSVRMAETPAQVREFLDRLLKTCLPAAQRELEEVKEFAKTTSGLTDMQPWDFHYFAERLQEQKYSFDEELLRPYFKLENVLNGAFELARRLFDLRFVKSEEYPVYHEDVQVFEVYKDNPRQDFIGLFYADFFPRPSKSQGAWMTNFFDQGLFRGNKIRPHVSIVCNFTKPSADQPSLLTFDEVSTLFHEFGHALHGLLSQVEHRSLSGTNVYLDFVELPSQILENWACEEELLHLFAHHYQTGETIPSDLIQRLKASQKYLAGTSALGQLRYGYLDLNWFSSPPQSGETVAEFETRVLVPLTLLPKIDGTNISCSFGHIFGGGYSSGYYSYKWAEVLDADAFELFQHAGIFDKPTAQKFEEFILSKGGSEHPMRLYEKFRGRAPDPEALLRRNGLIT